MIKTCLRAAATLAVLGGATSDGFAGSYVHQSPALYHRARPPCPVGQVMKPTGGGGARGVWSCAPR